MAERLCVKQAVLGSIPSGDQIFLNSVLLMMEVASSPLTATNVATCVFCGAPQLGKPLWHVGIGNNCGGIGNNCGGIGNNCGGVGNNCGGIGNNCGGVGNNCGGVGKQLWGQATQLAGRENSW